MKVSVRLFAGVKQVAGRNELEIELPDGATLAELRDRMAEEIPSVKPLLALTTFAVDARYATDETVIPQGATVACIPPVSGG